MNDLTIVNDSIDVFAEQFVSTITQYKWDLIPESQLQAAKKALTKSEYIMKAAIKSPEDVKNSLIQAAVLGLDLTEGKKQGWLLPRKNQSGNSVIQLQVGYKGVEAIHQRMGVIDRLVIRSVRENDNFEWSGDDQEKPIHKADWFKADSERGAITGAFAITYYPDKTINVVVSPISFIYEKHRNRSESYKAYKYKKDNGKQAYPPPWVSDEQSMVEKTMAYIAAKQWPANIRDEVRSSKILETLHEIDSSDYSYGYTKAQKEAFFSLLDAKDNLGSFLFNRRVGIEVQSGLTSILKSTFPKGKKTIMMSEYSSFIDIGSDLYSNITHSLDNNDTGLFNENIEGISELAYKLLLTNLSKERINVFKLMEKETLDMKSDND